ncbi:MMPL family transporter, partial [Burkholderia multivorans]
SRARSLLAEGLEPQEAAGRATATAGSAVVFAGLTVMIALLGLSLAGIPFLTVMGIGASGAVAIAVMISLSMVPALLASEKGKTTPNPPRRYRKAMARAEAAAASGGPDPRTDPAVLAEAGEPYPATRTDRFFAGWLSLVTKAPIVTIVLIVGGLSLFAI